MDQTSLIKQLVPFLTARGYEPGERIPSERELSARFGASRGQVREALVCLEALRVVERRAKSGLFMAEGEPSIEALATFARVGVPLAAADVSQTVEMRRIHEVEAVRLACERRTGVNLARMRDILAATVEHIDDPEEVAARDRMFHAEIVRATQNDIFLRIVTIFYLMTAERRIVYFQDPDRRHTSLEEHRSILAAIEARDGNRAVELIRKHLQGVDSYWRGLAETGNHNRPAAHAPPPRSSS